MRRSRHRHRPGPAATYAALALTFLLSCGEAEEAEPTPTLPPVQETPTPTPFPYDPGDVDTPTGDLEPQHTLEVVNSGAWELTPPKGPYGDILSGTLLITESVDGAGTFSCELEFNLTTDGAGPIDGCPTCDLTFSVLHTLVSGDPEACLEPDLPEDQVYRRLGFSETDGLIYYDYNDTGEWLPWYDAYLYQDTVVFEWRKTLGVMVEE